VASNGWHGITVNGGDNNHFVENTANNNLYRGIFLYRGVGNMLEENTANGNGDFGITTEGGNTVTGCFFQGNAAFGNGNLDLLDGNPACATDLWSDNSFGTAYPDCVQ
jgi:parallel beta-helix repeat protein